MPAGNQRIEVEIEKLGFLGDGETKHNDKVLRVPLSLPGERWIVDVVQSRGGSWQGRAVKPLRLMPRSDAICHHFGSCGGCALQHLTKTEYDGLKRRRIIDALANRGVGALVLHDTNKSPIGSRRRMRLAFDGGGRLGLRARAQKRIIQLNQCPIASPAIENALGALSNWTKTLRGQGELTVTVTAAGLDLFLISDKRPGIAAIDALDTFENLARLAFADSPDAHPEILALRSDPAVRIGGVTLAVPPGSFLQATAAGEAALQDFAIRFLGDAGSVADLFCGLGTFSLPLARSGAKVSAFDSFGPSISALRSTGLCHHTEVRDLIAAPLGANPLSRFDAAILDPPRAGALAQCREIAQSKLRQAVYVSCDPKSFARDAEVLCAAGFVLNELLPVDQFLYSAEIELIANFSRH